MKDGKEELKDIESEIRARAVLWPDEYLTRYDLRLAERIGEARELEYGNLMQRIKYLEAQNERLTRNELDRLAEHCTTCARTINVNALVLRKALEEQLHYWNAHIRNYSEEAMRQRTEAALAAPARNCDLFADYASALEYWQTHEECAEVNGCFDVWLMARAEGGKA